MNPSRWQRPIFGPFRRQRTGVPADHFPRFGDGRRVLIADGPAILTDEDRATRRAAFMAVLASVAPFDVSTAAQGLIVLIDASVDELMEELGIPDDDDETTAAAAAVIDRTLAAWPEPVPLADGAGLAVHAKFNGTHVHEHSAMGQQGGDSAHSHEHSHKNDASHGHGHSLAVAPPVGDRSGRTIHNLGLDMRRRVDGANEVTEPDELSALVASAFEARGGHDAWLAQRADQGLTAATNASGQVVPADWHAYLCVEGIRTDDGRELCAGSCRFPDLPISLRLLIEDEGGHWGAVTCGRIDSMSRVTVEGLDYIYSEGQFGSDDNGQLAELMVREQTQRFVSIDPRDVTAEWVEVMIQTSGAGPGLYGYDDDDGAVYDCWLRIADCVIGGATIVAMPALPQACITLKEIPLPEAPIANASAPAGLVAAGGVGPTLPPAAWFRDPGFYVGDPRLVKQRNGGAACPLTVTEDGQVYGHVSYWQAEHTGFLGQKVHPPHSKHNYAFYQLGIATAVEADGTTVDLPAGHITMGCGHASTDPKLSHTAVIAHYDDGYGAIKMAKVCAGEDSFGIWVAGSINPERTPAEVAELRSLNLSGDWRHLGGRSDDKEMLAVLAVTVPGFPISRVPLVAAGPDGTPVEDGHLRAGYRDGEIVSLVASGIVRRLDVPAQLAQLQGEVDRLRELVRPLALSHARARVAGTLSQ